MKLDESYPEPICVRIEDISQTRIILGWTPSPATDSDFVIERRGGSDAFVEIAKVPATQMSFSDTELQPGICYTYRVSTQNAEGLLASSTPATACTLAELPAAPVEANAQETGPTETLLSWKPGDNTQVGFIVLRQADDAPFIPIAQLGAEATSFADTTITPGARYVYKIVAFNSGGNSAPALAHPNVS